MEDDPQAIERRKGRSLMRDGVWQVPEAERPQVTEPRGYNPKIEKMFSFTGNALPFSKEERTVAHSNIMQARREAANAAKKRLRERPHGKPQA